MVDSVIRGNSDLAQWNDGGAALAFQEKIAMPFVQPPAQPTEPDDWQALDDATASDPTAADAGTTDLSKPLAAAEALSKNWDAWGMHTRQIDFANPPDDLPQEAKDTLKYLAANPTLLDALDAGGGGTMDNVITKADTDAFIKLAKSDLSSATNGLTGTSLWDKATAGLDPASQAGTEASLNAPIANAELLTANWHGWGLHQGIDFNNPPTDLPPEAQAVIKYFGAHPTLLSAIAASNGDAGGGVTQADFSAYIDKARSDADNVSEGDLSVWAGLTTGGTDQTAQEVALDKPIATAQLIAANWTSWGLHSGINFANPPSDLPPEAQDALKYVASNPALLTALDTASSGGGAADGIIQLDDVNKFISTAKTDAQNASNAYADYVKNNPDAGDLSKQLVLSAALVSANQQLVQNADPSHAYGAAGEQKNDGLDSAAGLAALATANPGLSTDLTGAAKLWGQPGMFSQLDMAGDDPAIHTADGLSSAKNLNTWISKQAPKNDQQFTDILSDAANRNMVSSVDTSNLGADVFANPSNYSGAQKAAVLQQLNDLSVKIAQGDKESYWDEPLMENKGINPNIDKVQADLKAKIAQLSGDSDVQSFVADNRAAALQSIAGSDPALHATMQTYYDGALQSGQALNDALAAKGTDGKPLTTEQGLQVFIGEAGVFAQAMGTDGKSTTDLKLQSIVQKSGQEATLEAAYTKDILSGAELKDAIAAGTDISTAVQQFTADAAAFGSVLSTDFVQANASKLQQTYSDTLSDAVLGAGTSSDLAVAFGDGNGNVDTAKITQIVTTLAQQDPDLLTDSQGQPIAPDKIVNTIAQAFNEVRQGAKLDDALNKALDADGNKQPGLTGPLANAYKQGLLHAVSAVFTGGILAAKSAEGAHSATADAGIAASAAQLMGGVMEAGSKYAKANPGSAIIPLSPDALKPIESAGKTLGGIGSAIGGALSIFSGVQDLKNGDQAGAGVGIASGITGIWSGVAGIIEGGVGLAESFGFLGADAAGIGATTAALGATAATLGIIGAGIGILGILGLGIYELVEQSKHTFQFTDQTSAALNKYGITGGPVEPGDTTPLPMTPQGTI